jgi:hypothetical protein
MALGEPTVGCLQFDRENAAGKLLIRGEPAQAWSDAV